VTDATCAAQSMAPGHTCGLPPLHDGDTHTAYWEGKVFAVWGMREKEEEGDE